MTDPLERVCADPFDREARLVHADWLSERGDRRGAYIRDALAGKQVEPDKAWAAFLKGLSRSFSWNDGYIERITLPGPKLDRLPEIRSQTPLVGLKITKPREARDFSVLDGLHTLCLDSQPMKVADFERLFASEALTELVRLDLSNTRLGKRGGEALTNAMLEGRLPALRELSLRGQGDLSPALTSSPALAQLDALDLTGSLYGPGFEPLLDNPALRSIGVLDISDLHPDEFQRVVDAHLPARCLQFLSPWWPLEHDPSVAAPFRALCAEYGDRLRHGQVHPKLQWGWP